MLNDFAVISYQLFLLLALTGSLVVVGYATYRRRTSRTSSSWQRFSWYRMQVTGAIAAPWFLLAFLYLPAEILATELVAVEIFYLGLFLALAGLPMIILVWKFGPRSLTWTRDSIPSS